MKVIIGLLIVGGIVIFLLYQFGGYASIDPAEQAAAFRENVNEGMAWDKVADLKEPREVVPIRPGSSTGEGPTRDFDRQQMTDVVQNGSMADGFIFRYRFSPSHHYDVIFSGQGTVREVYEPPTTKDLLQGELYTR
ncbi:MAG: hypothetical protein ACODAQ_13200 [Phycisphaeraceae bacterium]